MFLHVCWLFCQMAHQAFQDGAGATNGVPDVESTSSATNGGVGGVEAPARRARHGTAEQQRLLIWPFLVFSSLNARKALINFHFGLSGALSQLTVVLISAVFGQRERCSPTCLCRLEVLQKIHKASDGMPTCTMRTAPRSASLFPVPGSPLSHVHHRCIRLWPRRNGRTDRSWCCRTRARLHVHVHALAW